MTDSSPQNPIRDLLNDAERRQVIAILANGSTRRIAARVVGCVPSLITRTATCDPDFARQLARAEHGVELESLKWIRRASHDEKYWRAAAWTLERKNPEDFGLRRPSTVSLQDTQALFRQLMASLRGVMPAQQRLLLYRKFSELIGQLDIPAKSQVLLELAQDAAADQPASEEPPRPDAQDGP